MEWNSLRLTDRTGQACSKIQNPEVEKVPFSRFRGEIWEIWNDGNLGFPKMVLKRKWEKYSNKSGFSLNLRVQADDVIS